MLLSPTGSTTYPLLNGIDRGTAIRCVATVLRHARSEEEARMFLAMLIDPGGVIG